MIDHVAITLEFHKNFYKFYKKNFIEKRIKGEIRALKKIKALQKENPYYYQY